MAVLHMHFLRYLLYPFPYRNKLKIKMSSCPYASTLQAFFLLVMSYIKKDVTDSMSSMPNITDGATYDFIIVGAGSAGCVLANRLSEVENYSVLLVEAGGEEPYEADIPAFLFNLYGSAIDWKYTAEPQKRACGGERCTFARGKTLGGTSAINAMIYNRGNPLDYDAWAAQGNSGWSYKEILSYFKKSENNLDTNFANDTKFHSTGGYLSVSQFPYVDRYAQAIFDASREVGFKPVDFNSDRVSGVMRLQATQDNGKRMSTNLAFLKPIRNKRENLHIATGVRVTKLLIHVHNKTAYGVQYVFENQRNRSGKVFARREVILSAGAFNSPQILLLSGIGPEITLKQHGIFVIQNSKVGYNLQDHFSVPGIRFQIRDTRNITDPHLEFLPQALEYIKPKRTGLWSSTATLQISINYQSNLVKNSTEYPDIQIYFFPNSTCGEKTNPFVYYDIINFIPILLRPKSRGLVTINTTDPFSHPIIYTNYFNASQDIDTVLEASKVAHQLANTTAFKKVGLVLDTTYEPTRSQIETGSNPFWKRTPVEFMYSICHPCGTCKMGPDSDPDAVVDAQLKVYGIANLRVVDASIMPTITSGNLNAAVIMIAEKAADLIKKSHS